MADKQTGPAQGATSTSDSNRQTESSRDRSLTPLSYVPPAEKPRFIKAMNPKGLQEYRNRRKNNLHLAKNNTVQQVSEFTALQNRMMNEDAINTSQQFFDLESTYKEAIRHHRVFRENLEDFLLTFDGDELQGHVGFYNDMDVELRDSIKSCREFLRSADVARLGQDPAVISGSKDVLPEDIESFSTPNENQERSTPVTEALAVASEQVEGNGNSKPPSTNRSSSSSLSSNLKAQLARKKAEREVEAVRQRHERERQKQSSGCHFFF